MSKPYLPQIKLLINIQEFKELGNITKEKELNYGIKK